MTFWGTRGWHFEARGTGGWNFEAYSHWHTTRWTGCQSSHIYLRILWTGETSGVRTKAKKAMARIHNILLVKNCKTTYFQYSISTYAVGCIGGIWAAPFYDFILHIKDLNEVTLNTTKPSRYIVMRKSTSEAWFKCGECGIAQFTIFRTFSHNFAFSA